MSKSIILKLAFAVLLLLPTTGKAAELKFNDKTWPVEILETNEVEVKFVRNDFDLQETATSVLTGKKQVKKSKLYNPTTLGQIETALLEINRPPQSAEMVIENNRAVKFQPDLLGQALDLYELRKRLKPDSQIVELPVN
ncbi:MAG TPA: hypothetical protein VD998_03330, partial [Verrucomicrobiae bacterium]|nr:hypothetical protein [Verrucomicrobiae bacterium]